MEGTRGGLVHGDKEEGRASSTWGTVILRVTFARLCSKLWGAEDDQGTDIPSGLDNQ